MLSASRCRCTQGMAPSSRWRVPPMRPLPMPARPCGLPAFRRSSPTLDSPSAVPALGTCPKRVPWRSCERNSSAGGALMSTLAALKVKPVRSAVSAAEWQARVDLAACFRLIDLYGMSDMIYTHATARVPDEAEHFLINPHGMLFREVTASSLLKVHLDGRVVLKPDLDYGLQEAGYVIHSALYRAR